MDLRFLATNILRYKCILRELGCTCIFFLKNLTLLFWRLRAIRCNLLFKENFFIEKSMKIHSCKSLVLCYSFKYFFFFWNSFKAWRKIQISLGNNCHFKSNVEYFYFFYIFHILRIIFSMLKIWGFFLINIMIISSKCSKSYT